MSARFAVGDKVRIAAISPPLHHRVPDYAKGKVGVVERLCGVFGRPEALAEGAEGKPDVMLYRVRLKQGEIWPDYPENQNDRLELEVFEHWLEPAGKDA